MDELDNILNDSPSENPVETEDVEQPKETVEADEKESDSNKLEVEDQENENSSDRQVDEDAQVPQEDEEQESDKKEEDDQEEEAQNAKDDEEKDEASEGETKKERRKRRKEKKSKKDKKDKKDKKRKKKSRDDDDENLKSKIFGDSEDEDEDSKGKDADFDTADVDIEEEGKRALEEIVEKKKEKKKKRRDREEKKKSRSSKRRKGEEDEDAVPEQVVAPSNEPNDFDLVIESLKKGHRRRKSEGPPEGSEDFVRSFVHKMDAAAEEDIRANQQHLPALNKVKLLPEVSTQLAKKFLHEIFVSSGVLVALKKWLDPLPDGSLPNIKVREVVLHGLLEMGNHVQTEDLRESGIGKAIMVLSKHPQETLANKKTAKALIELWSRPIFNLSSKYKDMHRAEDRPVAEAETEAPTPVKSVKAVSTDLEHSPSGISSTKPTKDSPSLHARIPDKIALDFKVMPRINEEASRLLSLPKRGGDSKGVNRKSPGNKKVDRAVVMSIEGRGVYH